MKNCLREPETCQITYCGYSNPRAPEELEFEILGLIAASKAIEQRIATLKQTNYFVQVKIKEEQVIE